MLKNSFIILFFLTACSKDVGIKVTEPKPYCETHPSGYKTIIQPILLAKCSNTTCHSSQMPIFGDYAIYDSVKSKVNKGTFKRFVFELKIMPPNTFPPLNEEELKLIQCWLDNGAPNN